MIRLQGLFAMSQLLVLAIALLMVTSDCSAACSGVENATLTFDLQGLDLAAANSINWYYYGSEGNTSTRIAAFFANTFVPLGAYATRLTRNNASTVNVILSQPKNLDKGYYGCVIAFPSTSRVLDNISLALTDGATPENLNLTLTFNKTAAALQCNIAGLTSLGEAVLAISGNDGTIIRNGTSLPLTVDFNQTVTDQSCTCFLTGPGAECSDVASNGTVTVSGLGTSAGTTPFATTDVTPGPGPFPSNATYSSSVSSPNNPSSFASLKTEPSTPSTSTEIRSNLTNPTVVTDVTNNGSKNSYLVGAIVGGCVGGFFGMVCIGLLVVCCIRKQRRNGASGYKSKQNLSTNETGTHSESGSRRNNINDANSKPEAEFTSRL